MIFLSLPWNAFLTYLHALTWVAGGSAAEEIVGKTMREVVGPEAWRGLAPCIEVALGGKRLRFGEGRSVVEMEGNAEVDNDTGPFLRLNTKYCEIVGYSEAEPSEQRTYSEIVHPDDLVGPTSIDDMRRVIHGLECGGVNGRA